MMDAPAMIADAHMTPRGGRGPRPVCTHSPKQHLIHALASTSSGLSKLERSLRYYYAHTSLQSRQCSPPVPNPKTLIWIYPLSKLVSKSVAQFNVSWAHSLDRGPRYRWKCAGVDRGCGWGWGLGWRGIIKSHPGNNPTPSAVQSEFNSDYLNTRWIIRGRGALQG